MSVFRIFLFSVVALSLASCALNNSIGSKFAYKSPAKTTGCTACLAGDYNIAKNALEKIDREQQRINAQIAQVVEQDFAAKATKKTQTARQQNLWRELISQQQLAVPHNARVKYYAKNPAMQATYLSNLCSGAKPYLYDMMQVFKQRQLPLDLLLLPAIESNFNPRAQSSKRAVGLWQFIPTTAKYMRLRNNSWFDGRKDPHSSTRAAAAYLQYLNEMFAGNWLHTLAAYNAGPGTIKRAIAHNRRHNLPTDYWSLKLPRETMHYVPKFLALLRLSRKHEFSVAANCKISNRPVYRKVQLNGQLDLSVAADLANISLSELKRYNLGMKRWATPPGGPHALNIPIAKASVFATKEKQLAPNQRMRWIWHKIKPNETLGHIAKRYKVSINTLKSINNIRGYLIREGRRLKVPTSPAQFKP